MNNETSQIQRPNAQVHRDGPDDPSKAEPTIVAGSGESSCWADAQSAKGIL
jgi:hypothetical protein